jgi:competence protein ComEC
LSVDVDRMAGLGAAGQPEQAVTGGVLLSVVGSLAASRVDEWRAGRRVRMPVALRRPSRYLDPGVPDNERALARRGTILVGTVKSGALVDVLSRGWWWSEAIASVRGFARRSISSAVGPWSARSAAIVAAIVIGDRAGLDDEVQRRLQEAGTYHVIAISGGNIAILAGLLIGAFRVAGLLGRGAMVSAILALMAYAGLVGGGASVDRATLMATVYFAGRAVDHRSPPLNTLAFVAALIVAAEPLSVTDPAFVLTFGATLAILTAAPLVSRVRLHRWVTPVVMMFAASVGTEAMLLPVGAFVFSRVTFAGLALNFLAIPLMGVAQIAGMAVVPLTLVSTRLALVVGFVAHIGAAGLVWSAQLVRFVPTVVLRVAPPSWPVMAVYYMALCACWIGWRRKSLALVAVMAAVWFVAEPWALLGERGDGRLHVTFLDVGQGDSILVRFPQGSTLLVDAGGLTTSSSSFDIGDRVVAPVLRREGIRRLDYVALTHGDPDHIGGARSVIREFRPREVWEGIPVPRFAPLTELRMQTLAAHGTWVNVYAGHRTEVDGVNITELSPPPADWERQRVRNDDSLVLELSWRDVVLLLTGDIGKAVEGELVETLAALPPGSIRVLKVPHHGSLTSSSVGFIQTFRPQVAVFTVGRSNHFGHPAPAVLQRYQDAAVQIFRTDQDGAVTLDTDGHSIDIHTFTGRRTRVARTP